MEPSLSNADFTGASMQGCTINGHAATPELFAALGAVGTQSMSCGQGQSQGQEKAPMQAPIPTASFTLLSLAGVSAPMEANLTQALAAGPQADLPNAKAAAAALNPDSPTNGFA